MISQSFYSTTYGYFSLDWNSNLPSWSQSRTRTYILHIIHTYYHISYAIVPWFSMGEWLDTLNVPWEDKMGYTFVNRQWYNPQDQTCTRGEGQFFLNWPGARTWVLEWTGSLCFQTFRNKKEHFQFLGAPFWKHREPCKGLLGPSQDSSSDSSSFKKNHLPFLAAAWSGNHVTTKMKLQLNQGDPNPHFENHC